MQTKEFRLKQTIKPAFWRWNSMWLSINNLAKKKVETKMKKQNAEIPSGSWAKDQLCVSHYILPGCWQGSAVGGNVSAVFNFNNWLILLTTETVPSPIKPDGKALQFIQAEKMFYEVALIELTALQGSTGEYCLLHVWWVVLGKKRKANREFVLRRGQFGFVLLFFF